MVSERVLSRTFIGRVPELDHLIARRRAAGEGRGGLVLIAGEAGIGKSRLVAEYYRRFGASAPGTIVSAECRPFVQRPLDPIVQVLSRLRPAAWEPRQAWDSREALLDAIVAAFDAAAQRRMRTVIFEDLQWADVDLIAVLTLLASRAEHRRLLFIGTYRDDELVSSNPIFAPFGRLVRDRSVSMLSLEPLTGAELSAFVNGILAETQLSVPSDIVDDVKQQSGGNPLFVEELLRHAVDRHRGGMRAARALPISLEAVIRERLQRCDTKERTLLSQASLFGRRFHIDLLGAVFGFEPAEVATALRRLCELQLLDAVEGTVDEYDFRHALTRDVIYHDVPPLERKLLHQRAAETIGARADAAEHVDLLAHSFWEAGLPDRAAPYCEAAGDAARDAYSYHEAIRWYERAAEAYDSHGESAARVLSQAAFAGVRLGDPERAATLHERAISLYIARSDFKEAVNVSKSLAGTYFNNGRSDLAISVFQSAIRLAEASGDPQLRRDVLIRLFSAFAGLRLTLEAQRCALEIDEAALDPNAMETAVYFLTRSSLHAQLGEVCAWRDDFERAVALFDRLDTGRALVRFAHGSIARQAQDVGEMAIAREHAVLGLELARQLRSNEHYMLALHAELEMRAGNLAVAKAHLRDMPVRGDFLMRHAVAVTAVKVGAYAGDDDLIRRHLDAGLIDEAASGGNRFATVTLATAFARGLERLGQCAEANAMLIRAIGAIPSTFGLAGEIITLARRDGTSAIRLRQLMSQHPGSGRSSVDTALTSLLNAAVATHEGKEFDARPLARDAAARFSQIGWPLIEAECLELADDVEAALVIYRRCGAFGELQRLERGAIGEIRPSKSDVLTPREREVAKLIAAGKSNLAAAESLGISQKAVEKYLTSIYGKLKIASRTQLAVYASSPDR
jgi:DNA-binding CsgD family transcriptional regulator